MTTPAKIERPYGPDQVIRLHVHRRGGHLKVRVWIGQEGAPGLCGELTMRFTDWAHFNTALLHGSRTHLAKVGVILEPGLKAWLNANASLDTIVGTVDEEYATPGAAQKARELGESAEVVELRAENARLRAELELLRSGRPTPTGAPLPPGVEGHPIGRGHDAGQRPDHGAVGYLSPVLHLPAVIQCACGEEFHADSRMGAVDAHRAHLLDIAAAAVDADLNGHEITDFLKGGGYA